MIYGFLLLVPFFLLRFGLLYLLDKDAIRRAAHFAPMQGNETLALIVYQISNLAIFLLLCFLRVQPSPFFAAGVVLYAFGLVLLTLSIVSFADTADGGFHKSGIYRFSRNPMYLSYFVFFLGCVLLTRSLLLLAILLVFQLCTHPIILAEERWCTKEFGQPYLQYKKRTRRYL